MTPEDMLKRVDENTIGVVPTLGVTHTGNFEVRRAERREERARRPIDMHVDVEAPLRLKRVERLGQRLSRKL
jgi:glutamate decarboxylase